MLFCHLLSFSKSIKKKNLSRIPSVSNSFDPVQTQRFVIQTLQKLSADDSLNVIHHIFFFLAHLSRRLVGELIVYPWSGVRLSSASVVVHNFKHEYLCNQWADRNQILSEASLGWGKGCIRFWARSDQNFSRLLFIRSFSYLLAMMTCMRAQTSSNFGLIGPPTAELAALERLKKSP